MAYRAVLFDFDGVVAETLPYHVRAWQQVFSKHQVKIEYKDIALQEGQGAHLIVGALAKQKGLKLSRAELDA
ncbi:MAG: HAD hydrolase-like protein, partial [bacterium]|nr:HAD hydrolase-like protein [bacterium]